MFNVYHLKIKKVYIFQKIRQAVSVYVYLEMQHKIILITFITEIQKKESNILCFMESSSRMFVTDVCL